MDQNDCILVGRLGQDPQSIQTRTGTIMARASLATWRSSSKTDWHNVTAFGSEAEKLLKASKGTGVKVYGSIQYDQYEKDGQKRNSTTIIANRVVTYASKDNMDKPKESNDFDNFNVSSSDSTIDEIPF